MEINAEDPFAEHDLKSEGLSREVFDFGIPEVRFYQCLHRQ